MPDETGNQLGQYLREKRESAGLSIRAAARKARFSEGRWRQLERGYQPSGAERIPVNPRPATVVQAADALGVDAQEALKVAGLDADVDEVRREIEQVEQAAGLDAAATPPSLGMIASEAVANGTLQQSVLALLDLLTPDEMGKVKLAIGVADMRASKDKADLLKEGVVHPDSLRDLDAITPAPESSAKVLNVWAEVLNAHHFYSAAYARADLAQQRWNQLNRLLRIDASPSNEALCHAAEKTLKGAISETHSMLKHFREAERAYDRAVAKDRGK